MSENQDNVQKSDNTGALEGGRDRGSEAIPQGDSQTALANESILNRANTLKMAINTSDTVKPTRPPKS